MILAHSLSYQYPSGPLLTFPDVGVAQGAALLLKGPSGCGKSTWLALVAGLVQPTSGRVQVAGQPLFGLGRVATDAWRATTIGFLPQKLHLSSALTVEQNLAMAQWAAGQPEDSKRTLAALEALGVADLVHRKPGQLSGGQAQRVALARAVLLQPRVILADEPTASLDDEACADAVRLLLHTAGLHGSTLVIGTHDGRVASLLATMGQAAADVHTLSLQRAPATGVGAAETGP
jgi:putative ABC transport system ATP-binding protein